jgi:hypothetical protein
MRQILCALVLLSQLFGLIGLSPSHAVALQSNQRWRAASYRGLAIGKSTRAQMLRVFRKPKWHEVLGKGSDAEVWYHYEGIGELPGELVVVVGKRSGIILGIDLHPQNLTKEKAIEHFGPDYRITRYDFDSCLSTDGGESAPLYESPDGAVTLVEYRDRGIAIGVNYKGEVDQVQYVSKPVGARRSKCKGRA